MVSGSPRILLVDADSERCDAHARALDEAGFAVTCRAETPPAGGKGLAGVDLALVAATEEAPAMVEHLRRLDPLVPVVVHAAERPRPELAARLGRARVYDLVHLREPSDLGAVVARLRDAAARAGLRRRAAPVAEDLLGDSPKVAQVRRYIERAAASEANVLILGESGTGKELVARAIHRHSSREEGPFVAVNVSAIPETLLESDLFGHEKGAFTGAVARTRGRFEQADGGTLFFDEIGEMPPALQAKLLRVLQPPPGVGETVREFTRVGAETPSRADVRLVFATHRDLAERVRAGAFREDLLQRVNVLTIHVPPLRERREDIPLLAQHFLRQHAALEGRVELRFDPLVLDVLSAYDHPLNVRELEGLVRSIVILKESGSTIVLGDLPPHLFGGADPGDEGSASVLRTLAEVEAEHVRRVMDHAGGNKSRAARILGISRPALDRRLKAT